jgi:hypothetical protein
MKSRYANDWIKAMISEQHSFKEHNVMKLVPRSKARGKKIFNARPVLKIKVNPPTLLHPNGSIEKFKYRLTIAAFKNMMKQGIDFTEKYASTVRWNSIKVLLAIACYMDYDLVLFDISTFFLYGKMPKGSEVYMEQAEGWEHPDFPKEDYVNEVTGNIYGHPAAANIAQQELKKTFVCEGEFETTNSDDCVYVTDEKMDCYSAAGAHVDDMVSIGDNKGLGKIRSSLSKNFEITEKHNPEVITGVQIERNRESRWLKIHQTAYTKDLLKKENMLDCNGAETPLDPGSAKKLMLLPTDAEDPVAIKLYQILVGCLIWLLKTRPDMYFTVCLLSRYLKNATMEHLAIARGQPLRYLKRTMTDGIVFMVGATGWVLSGASDADLAGDLESSRSTLGYFGRLGKFGAILTSCKLERKICTSTGHAETYAFMSLLKDIVWLSKFLIELRFPVPEESAFEVDNSGVVKQSTKVVNHTMAKHYRIAQAYIREKCREKLVKLVDVASKMNASDMFTKALHGPVFKGHAGVIMGPQSPPLKKACVGEEEKSH